MRTRPEIEAELVQCLHRAIAPRIAQLETSLKETLHLMEVIEELTRLVPITVGIASRTVAERRTLPPI